MRVVIADDHPVVLMGIRAALSSYSDRFQLVGEASSGPELIELLSRVSCDLLITDYAMSEEASMDDGLYLLKGLREKHNALPVIVLTMISNPALINGMLAAGVRGIVDKMAMTKELMLAIETVRAGRIYLSEHVKKLISQVTYDEGRKRSLSAREADVVRLFAQGMSVTEIARQTGRSVRTISQQKRDAMRKLGIEGDKQLHEYARSGGLV